MKLTIYSGSPRGKKSNSDTIANYLCEGLGEETQVTRFYLRNESDHDAAVKESSDAYFVVFPLYADAMPYTVKLFFEKMEENKQLYENKPIYFFIHSGFPEAKQSRILERYLKYFSKIIGAKYMGCAIMGNSEVTRYLKADSKRLIKIKENLNLLAEDIKAGKPFNENSIKYFKGAEIMPKPVMFLLKKFPNVFNKGFDMMIKRNGAYDKRFDKPYA